MGSRRRLIALATALCVAWTSLWPLVSSAHLLVADESVPLCHQAGMQVAPGMAPMQPGAPKEAKQHCPLCLMAFLAAFSLPVVASTPPQLDSGIASPVHWAPLPPGIEVQLPQSRAPPVAA